MHLFILRIFQKEIHKVRKDTKVTKITDIGINVRAELYSELSSIQST